ncbi:carboxymuconolactone decarboxylase family protein (plasmid) [Rhizobium sp. CC1099]|uniref:carboxymuconolactone decarboxylase family protein n=1 Tax=Rhizobium sp. CC1099 TaxID=3039160 RepID=UPI0024B1366A|nr:carboxymuconolactone decarboxylase family protein [Rhizobium sp. CC1099]WFU90666.1 carboxymuconolactone decarboxylase family protein [Rhizobium sp. CC1099]
MLDWKKNIHDVNGRLKELALRTPDTLRGAALLAGAGAKTNHLDAKTRQLIALAVAVTTRCDGCIAFHSAEAVKLGVSDDEIAEALGVAINLNTGAAMVYSSHVLDAVSTLKA